MRNMPHEPGLEGWLLISRRLRWGLEKVEVVRHSKIGEIDRHPWLSQVVQVGWRAVCAGENESRP